MGPGRRRAIIISQNSLLEDTSKLSRTLPTGDLLGWYELADYLQWSLLFEM
jgi:hypothetical protein